MLQLTQCLIHTGFVLVFLPGASLLLQIPPLIMLITDHHPTSRHVPEAVTVVGTRREERLPSHHTAHCSETQAAALTPLG